MSTSRKIILHKALAVLLKETFSRTATLSPNPDKPEKQNLYHETTKVRKLEKENIKISCFPYFVFS